MKNHGNGYSRITEPKIFFLKFHINNRKTGFMDVKHTEFLDQINQNGRGHKNQRKFTEFVKKIT